MADCGHGMPTPAACIDCMADGPLPEPPRPKRKGWPFTATYAGTCRAGCDGIEPGDKIVLMDDGTYRHMGVCERAR